MNSRSLTHSPPNRPISCSKVCTNLADPQTLAYIAEIDARELLHLLTSEVFHRGQIASVRQRLVQTCPISNQTIFQNCSPSRFF
jgi:hypothetical protein